MTMTRHRFGEYADGTAPTLQRAVRDALGACVGSHKPYLIKRWMREDPERLLLTVLGDARATLRAEAPFDVMHVHDNDIIAELIRQIASMSVERDADGDRVVITIETVTCEYLRPEEG